MFELILYALFVEAITQLIHTAAPLQSIREYIRQHTPSLYSTKQDKHLLDCKYCTSVWIAFFTIALYYAFSPNIFLTIIFYSCIVHRISNYLHIIIGVVRDQQINMRLARGRNNV